MTNDARSNWWSLGKRLGPFLDRNHRVIGGIHSAPRGSALISIDSNMKGIQWERKKKRTKGWKDGPEMRRSSRFFFKAQKHEREANLIAPRLPCYFINPTTVALVDPLRFPSAKKRKEKQEREREKKQKRKEKKSRIFSSQSPSTFVFSFQPSALFFYCCCCCCFCCWCCCCLWVGEPILFFGVLAFRSVRTRKESQPAWHLALTIRFGDLTIPCFYFLLKSWKILFNEKELTIRFPLSSVLFHIVFGLLLLSCISDRDIEIRFVSSTSIKPSWMLS